MKVPLLDLRLQYASIRDAILSAVTRVCDSQQFIMGPEVEQLESEIAAALGVPHAVAVSSGTDALLVALMALGIGDGDEVITPTFLFFGPPGSVARIGARPVFVDVDPDTLMIDIARVREAIHRQECFAGRPHAGMAFPNADAAASDVLALPIYPELTHEQQEYVVSSVAECVV